MNLQFSTACAAATLIAALGVTGLAAGDSTSLMKKELQGVDGMEVNIVDYDVGSDWASDRHIHPGHLFVYVTEGTIEIAVEGEDPRTIAAGEVYYKQPNQPMVGRSVSTEGAKFTVFQVGPIGEPIMVSQPE
ncbi:cupin domain-containing protein [Halomonas sp. CS7]|uniref:Cupin domain-containing protein n=1 Tax=Halomonas pelophila TaxID=3151122 RepID=A0ABV1N8G7_9GAMM